MALVAIAAPELDRRGSQKKVTNCLVAGKRTDGCPLKIAGRRRHDSAFSRTPSGECRSVACAINSSIASHLSISSSTVTASPLVLLTMVLLAEARHWAHHCGQYAQLGTYGVSAQFPRIGRGAELPDRNAPRHYTSGLFTGRRELTDRSDHQRERSRISNRGQSRLHDLRRFLLPAMALELRTNRFRGEYRNQGAYHKKGHVHSPCGQQRTPHHDH